MNNQRFHRSEEARRQAKEAALEVKEREIAALEERAAMFASETRKVENLRALRLAVEKAVKGQQSREADKPLPARKDLAA